MPSAFRLLRELPSADWTRLEQILRDFEAALERGERPRFDDFVPPEQALRRPLLVELMHMDLEHRLKAGEPARVEDYLENNPDVAGDQEAMVGLIAWEYRLRRRQEPALVLQDYFSRFPEYRTALVQYLDREGEMRVDAETRPPNAESLSGAGKDPDGSAPSPAQAAAVPPSLPGSTDLPVLFIGKYRLVERLGSGGQGEVFRAIHPTLGRDVVIKLARQDLPEAALLKLIDEGRVLARLDDPGLVQVYDVDVHEGRPYVVFEYIPGRSLAERLKHQRPSCREAAALTADLAGTLARLHDRGVLHRDLKPANVLIDDTGRPRLLDFGLASLAEHWSAINVPGPGVSGTPAYMAPEQARGETEYIGPRTDLFNLGSLLYELLTGRPPYQGIDTRDVLAQARAGQVAPARQLNPRIPAALERICMKALAADPAQRHASAEHLQRALRSNLARRRRVAGGLGVTVLLGAAVLALVFGLPGRPHSSSPPVTQLAPPMAELKVLAFDIRAFRENVGPLGDVGVTVHDLRKDDDVRIHARLSAPGYCYLIAFNPDGKEFPCYPENRAGIPNLVEEFHYPAGSTKVFQLNDGVGMQAFVLLVSRKPLPPYSQWREDVGRAPWWRAAQVEAVWRFDGKEFEGTRRAKVRELESLPRQLIGLCDFFKDRQGIDALRVVAFPVRQ
jgi:predicted Ser/Thr protein kinase